MLYHIINVYLSISIDSNNFGYEEDDDDENGELNANEEKINDSDLKIKTPENESVKRKNETSVEKLNNCIDKVR